MLTYLWLNGAYSPANIDLEEQFMKQHQKDTPITFLFIKGSSMIQTVMTHFESNNNFEDKIVYIYSNEQFVFDLHYSPGSDEYFGWLKLKDDAKL